ncbi:MAG: hypothetical protein LC775_18700 [Acidobacteria bacterium]|nr:hypothetical protein [Acidobacteriota bacterium]
MIGDLARGADVRTHLPWLGQGDIFGEIPVVGAELDHAGNVRVYSSPGPAVLLTHDCAMDKPDKATGLPRVERLQFARLRSITALPSNRQASLRGAAKKLGPFEALHLGEIPQFGETFVLLTDPYYLPAQYFDLALLSHINHPEAEPVGAEYTTPQRRDTRIGRIDAEQLDLLRRKMFAYWTRLKPSEG